MPTQYLELYIWKKLPFLNLCLVVHHRQNSILSHLKASTREAIKVHKNALAVLKRRHSPQNLHGFKQLALMERHILQPNMVMLSNSIYQTHHRPCFVVVMAKHLVILRYLYLVLIIFHMSIVYSLFYQEDLLFERFEFGVESFDAGVKELAFLCIC